jgi:hypothetical protein
MTLGLAATAFPFSMPIAFPFSMPITICPAPAGVPEQRGLAFWSLGLAAGRGRIRIGV